MLRLSYTSPCEIQGTLFLKRNPFMSGIGFYDDIDGVTWDVLGIMKNSNQTYVQARRLTDSSSYYGTASWDTQNGSHTWKPYLVNIMKEGEKNEI